jgi:phage baseplate assembly protein W
MLTGANLGEKRVIVSNTTDLETGSTVFVTNRGFSNTPTTDDTFKVYLELFSSRRPVTPETMAFGRDIMGVFTKVNGVTTDGTIDIMLGPRKDLATVQGQENLEQAITLALQTPRGSNKSNPLYGTADVIGRPQEPNIAALNIFYVRQSLLQDPRISSVERPEVSFIGGAMYFTVYVRPVRVQRTLFLRIPL